MKKIIVFFHGSQMGNNLHPFVINEIDLLRKAFDEVYLICLKPSCGFDEIEQYSNVHVYSIGLKHAKMKTFKAMCDEYEFELKEYSDVVRE